MSADIIFIRDMVIDVHIGVYENEKNRTQRVRINVAAEPEIWPNAGNDNLDDAVSYDLIINHIFAITKDRHINLLETLAENIASACLGEKIKKVTVRIEKLDIYPYAIAGVEITRFKA